MTMEGGGAAARLYAVVGADIDEFTAKMAEVDGKINDLAGGEAATAKIAADTNEFEDKVGEVEEQLKTISDEPATAEILAETADFDDKMQGAFEALQEISEADVQAAVGVDNDAAMAAIDVVQERLNEIEGTRATASIDVDSQSVTDSFDQIDEHVEGMGDQIEGTFAESASDAAAGMEKTIGKSFSRLKKKFAMGIVLAITAVGLEKIQGAINDFKAIADASSMGEGPEKWAAQIATLDKAIGDAKGNLQFLGAFDPTALSPNAIAAAEQEKQILLDKIANYGKLDAAMARHRQNEQQNDSARQITGGGGAGDLFEGVDPLMGIEAAVAEAGAKIVDAAGLIGRQTPAAIADGIMQARQLPLDAFDDLILLMKTPLTQTAETARLLGQLTGQKLAEGLAHADPLIRAKAREAKAAILDRLAEIEPRAGTLTKEAMDAVVEGMKSKDNDIRNAAGLIYDAVWTGVPTTSEAYKWGWDTADAYARGLKLKLVTERPRIGSELAEISKFFGPTGSPPGPKSPFHHVDKWGEDTGMAYVDGFTSGLSRIDGIIPDMLSGAAHGGSYASGASGGAFDGSALLGELRLQSTLIAQLVAQEPSAASPMSGLSELVRSEALMTGVL